MNLNKSLILTLVFLVSGWFSGCRTPETKKSAAPAPPTKAAHATKATSSTDQEMLNIEKDLERYQEKLEEMEEIEEEMAEEVLVRREDGVADYLILVETDGQEKIIDSAETISVLDQEGPWVVYQKNTALILYNFKTGIGKDRPLHQGIPYPNDWCDWKVVWSPDGSKLAYSTSLWPAYTLFVYDLETQKDIAFFYASLTEVPAWTEEGLEVWKWRPKSGTWEEPNGIEIDKTEIINP